MINEVLRCCVSLIITAWLLRVRAADGSAQRGERRSPSSRFCDSAEVSLITAHACLQTRPGSDGLERTLTVIAYIGLVCDQSGALHYLQGSVNKDLMQRMRCILGTTVVLHSQ